MEIKVLDKEKILLDSINGPKSFLELTISECLAVMTIHNKKFIEAQVECGNAFDLYSFNADRAFSELQTNHQLNNDELELIKVGNIYSNQCNFLFPQHNVTQGWIDTLLGLHHKGFLNFPKRSLDQISLLEMLLRFEKSPLTRSQLSKFPILIPTLNVMHSEVSSAELHFLEKTPQYYRYTEAKMICKRDPKALNSVHEVFASLIYLDEAIYHYNNHISPLLISSTNTSVLSEFVNAVKLPLNTDDLTERELNEVLQFSDTNMILNWLFDAKRMNKSQRVEFLTRLLVINDDLEALRDYLKENNLVPSQPQQKV